MSQEAHVVPRNDLVQHTVSEDCVCGPSVRLVVAPDGGDGWLYVHHPLDGRKEPRVET